MSTEGYLKSFIKCHLKHAEVLGSRDRSAASEETPREGENEITSRENESKPNTDNNITADADNEPDIETIVLLENSASPAEKILISEEDVNRFIEEYGDTEKSTVLFCAALLWQQMEIHYLGEQSVSNIHKIVEEIGEGHMGLIGPGNGSCTSCLERSFGRNKIFRLHSLPHDVAGRFRKVHNLGPGYLYTVTVKENEMRFIRWWRRVSLGGQVLGMIHAFQHRHDVQTEDCFKLISINM